MQGGHYLEDKLKNEHSKTPTDEDRMENNGHHAGHATGLSILGRIPEFFVLVEDLTQTWQRINVNETTEASSKAEDISNGGVKNGEEKRDGDKDDRERQDVVKERELLDKRFRFWC